MTTWLHDVSADESYDGRHAELQAEARRHQLLFEAAPACLLVTNAVGTILQANRAAAALLGRPFAQLQRMSLVSHVARADRSAFREALARVGLTEGVHDCRFALTRNDGVPVRVSAAIHLVAGVTASGLPALYWCLRAVPEQAS